MKINKNNALRLWEMCFGDERFAEDFHGYLMCKDGYGKTAFRLLEKAGCVLSLLILILFIGGIAEPPQILFLIHV